MIPKIILLITFIIGILFTTTSFSICVPTSSFKIAILDINQLIVKTGEIRRAKNNIHKEYSPQKFFLSKEEKGLQNEIRKCSLSRKKLKSEELKKWHDRINIRQNKLQQHRIMLQEKITHAKDAETKKIISYFVNLTSKAAKKNNSDLVLFKDIVAYNKLAITDITDELIKIFTRNSKS